MATNFPGSQDSLTNPSSGDTLDSPDHAGQHSDANDAIEAIELALLDGAPLHIDDANERVGIGTTSPDDPLHVVGDVTIEVADDGSAAQPEVTLHRGSASPADGDYLGQIKFSGKNDAGQTVNYAKITGKISDVTDATEDGLIEIANITAGSQSIGYRITSTDLKLINGRGLQVDGDVGIGTTSPAANLQVVSENRAFSVLDSGVNNNAEAGFTTLGGDAPAFGAISGYDVQIKTGTSRAGLATRMHVGNDGNVGIGTTAPDNKLHVQLAGTSKAPASVPATHMIIADAGDTNDAGFAVYSATTGKGYLRFGDSDASAQGGFSYDHSTNELKIRSNGTDQLTVASDGQLVASVVDVNEVRGDNGSETDPTFTFTDDQDTGIYRQSSDAIGFAAGGVEAARMGSFGLRGNNSGDVYNWDQFKGNNGTEGAPTFTFDDDGDTGMYRSGGNVLAFTTGGSIRALIYSVGLRIYTSGSYSAPSLHWGTDTNTGFYRHAENAIGVTTGGGRRTLWNTDANLYHYSQLLVPNMSTTGSYNTVRWNTSNGHLMRYSSTIDIKEDVVSIAPVLEYLNERSLIHDLRPVLFHEKDQPDGTNNTRGEYLSGMIAEEVLEVAPELCYYDYDGNLTSYGIEALIPHLVAEIQRLSPLVEEMYGDANPDWVAPVPRSADSYMAERVRYDEAAAAQAEIGLVIPAGFETEEE